MSVPWPLQSVSAQSRTWAFEKKWFHASRNEAECSIEVFQQPPMFAELPDAEGTQSWREKSLVNLHCAWQLHNASLAHAKQHCGDRYTLEPRKHYRCFMQREPMLYICKEGNIDTDLCGAEDLSKSCCEWARNGECANNANFMLQNCPIACGRCWRREAEWCLTEDEAESAKMRHRFAGLQAEPTAPREHDEYQSVIGPQEHANEQVGDTHNSWEREKSETHERSAKDEHAAHECASEADYLDHQRLHAAHSEKHFRDPIDIESKEKRAEKHEHGSKADQLHDHRVHDTRSKHHMASTEGGNHGREEHAEQHKKHKQQNNEHRTGKHDGALGIRRAYQAGKLVILLAFPCIAYIAWNIRRAVDAKAARQKGKKAGAIRRARERRKNIQVSDSLP